METPNFGLSVFAYAVRRKMYEFELFFNPSGTVRWDQCHTSF